MMFTRSQLDLATRAAASLSRQLRPSNFSRWPWCMSRSRSGATTTTSPSNAGQSSTGRLEVTTVAVTHDMRSARRIGQRILMLHQGRIHFSGTPEEIFQSKDPVVYRFVNGVSDPKEPHF